jgi:hypothetical protein
MAVTKRAFRNSEKYFKEGLKIAELGSQYAMEEEWGGYGPPYFRNIFPEFDITSLDMNGENQSDVVNLSFPIEEKYKNSYDLVTNFGTTEHVQNQYICWKNIFDITKLGGLVINEIPKKENWPGHCKFYFDESTFEVMKKDFEIVEVKDIEYERNGALIFCVLRKTHDKEFLTTSDELLEKILIIDSFDDKQGY